MAHLNLLDLKHDSIIPEQLDVLVIGAGMSGLYSTWRILKDNPAADIKIFERSGRTGGRLDSDLIHFSDGETVKEEEGGMRFTFDNMDNLMTLFLMLDLTDQIVPFPMSSGDNNRLYFRGKSFDAGTSSKNNYEIWSQLYNLAPAEQNINPSGILDTIFYRILSENPQFILDPNSRTPEFWQAFRLECQWKGVLLKDWSLWNLFSDMGYSNESITMLYGLAGFNGTYLSKMNAGEAYQLLEDFPSNPNFKTLENGFSSLPNALVYEISKERIFLKTELESIDEKTPEGYIATYTTIDANGNVVKGKIKVKKIILAMPRLPLEKLFVKSNALNVLGNVESEKLWNKLQTTTNQALVKINLYYDQAWWGSNLYPQPPVAYGPNFTDLPLGTVYPFYSIDEETYASLEYIEWLTINNIQPSKEKQELLATIANKKYGLPAALTIYCDYLNVNFWRALQENGADFDSAMQQIYNTKVPQTVFPASEEVVETATRFFKLLFNTQYVPKPVMTSARIWEGSALFNVPPSEQFDYGVHQWGLHANDAEVIPYLANPFENLYTCGEAYSDMQGWVEGALRSADIVLNKAFNLKPISVVYKEEAHLDPSLAISKIYDKNSAELIRKYIDPDFTGDC